VRFKLVAIVSTIPKRESISWALQLEN
jgi:hypothetical protein